MGGLCQTTLRRTGRCPQICRTRYTHRVAISNDRVLDIEDEKVRFRWKDYRECKKKTMTLTAEEFIRRFLLHVLPEGFQRIRYYGFLGNRYRKQKLARCRELLNMQPPEPHCHVKKDYRERYEELTGKSLKTCPVCRQGQMVTTEVFQAGGIPPPIWDNPITGPPIWDTS